MAFGILEDHKLDNVPGTGLLSGRGSGHPVTIDEARELKRGTGKYSHIILIPQPSDDPCDPLNWPRWKKEACFWTLIFTTSLAAVFSPLASAAFVLLAKQFHVSVDEIASSFSASFIGFAIFVLVQNPFAIKYGHRIVYLLSTFLMFISCAWTALSPDLGSIRASRIFQGFGEAAPHCLVPTTLEHIYFVHERGLRSSIWNFSRLAGVTLGPLIYSYVIQNLSWQLGFWFLSIACGLSFIGVFFFVPETTYHRQASPIHSNPTKHENGATDKVDVEKTPRPSESTMSDVEIRNVHHNAPSSNLPTFLSQLKIYHGTFSDESVWKIFLRPFPFILSPVTWFIFLSFSMPTVWLTLVGLCSSTIFTVKYGFNTAQIGLTHLGGLVGIVLAMIATGSLNDCMLFGVFGYVGWAVGNDHHMPWIGAVACIAMINFSTIVSDGAAVAYLIDTHGANSLHVLSITQFARGIISYSATFFANGIILSRGVKSCLLVLGACQAVCWLSCIPMYVYGKRVRSFVSARSSIRLFVLHLRLIMSNPGPVTDADRASHRSPVIPAFFAETCHHPIYFPNLRHHKGLTRSVELAAGVERC